MIVVRVPLVLLFLNIGIALNVEILQFLIGTFPLHKNNKFMEDLFG